MAQFEIEWTDYGREPQSKPNPAFPKGINLDTSMGAANTCLIDLPYPARRWGNYHITCKSCGLTAMVTTAGRYDDPRSLKVACNRKSNTR